MFSREESVRLIDGCVIWSLQLRSPLPKLNISFRFSDKGERNWSSKRLVTISRTLHPYFHTLDGFTARQPSSSSSIFPKNFFFLLLFTKPNLHLHSRAEQKKKTRRTREAVFVSMFVKSTLPLILAFFFSNSGMQDVVFATARRNISFQCWRRHKHTDTQICLKQASLHWDSAATHTRTHVRYS